jgi:hypothetical protein
MSAHINKNPISTSKISKTMRRSIFTKSFTGLLREGGVSVAVDDFYIFKVLIN